MRRPVRRKVYVAAGMAAAFVLATAGTAWASQWQRQSAPSPGRGGVLDAVTLPSPTDGWAVGSYIKSNHDLTLVEHYDGQKWTVVTSPDVTDHNYLSGVRATSATNAWAVGWSEDFTPPGDVIPVVLRWDGHHWDKYADAALDRTELMAVGTNSATNAWAVGLLGQGPTT